MSARLGVGVGIVGQSMQSTAAEHGRQRLREGDAQVQATGRIHAGGRAALLDQLDQVGTVLVGAGGVGIGMGDGGLDGAHPDPCRGESLEGRYRHLHDPGAESLEHRDGLIESPGHLRVHPVHRVIPVHPDAHVAHAPAQFGEVLRHGRIDGGGIVPVPSGDDLQHGGTIGGGPRHRSYVIQRIREREDAMAADPAPRGLDARQPTCGAGIADRPTRVAAERGKAQPRRGRHPRPGGGGADPMIRAPRIWGRGYFRVVGGIGALGHGQLAEDHGARRLQPVDDGGIVGCCEFLVDQRAGAGRGIGRVAEILYRDWDAMQGAPVQAPGDIGVRGLRLFAGTVLAEMHIALKPCVHVFDPVQHRLGDRQRGHLAGCDHRGNLTQFLQVQFA